MDIILDALIDTLKLMPFLYLTFVLLEYLEHKVGSKTEKIIEKSGKVGPLWGGLLGAFPQCGFSSAATNLYVARVISLGTLISVYLATSDEMLPIMLSSGVEPLRIIKIILLKVVIGIICGFIIDAIVTKLKDTKHDSIKHLCADDHCHCEEDGIMIAALKHTLNISLYILIVNVALSFLISYIGIEKLSGSLMQNSVLGPFIASLVGLIPNCASSVALTELYLNNIISFGSMMAGLLSAAGLGLLILYRENHHLKENIMITVIIYMIGVISGIIIDLLKIVI